MSDIVRSALKPFFERHFLETEGIVLSSRDFQLLAEEMRKTSTEDVLERRRH